MSFVPGAASTAVRDLLRAPVDAPVPAVVRHVSRSRVGLAVGARVLVLDRSADAATLPCTLTAPLLVPSDVGAPGDVVRLDVDGVHGRRQTVRVARWWDPPRVVPATGGSVLAPSATRSRDLDDTVAAALGTATRALVEGRADAAAAALTAVLGRGPGSTPDADDAVAGLLLAARHDLPARTGEVERAARIVARTATTRTTALSAELLRLAAAGLAAAAVVEAVTAPTTAARAALLRLGGTSGRSTAAGIDLFRSHLTRTSSGRAA